MSSDKPNLKRLSTFTESDAQAMGMSTSPQKRSRSPRETEDAVAGEVRAPLVSTPVQPVEPADVEMRPGVNMQLPIITISPPEDECQPGPSHVPMEILGGPEQPLSFASPLAFTPRSLTPSPSFTPSPYFAPTPSLTPMYSLTPSPSFTPPLFFSPAAVSGLGSFGTEPPNLQVALANQNPFSWGQILTDVFELTALELQLSESEHYIEEAERVKRRSDRDTDHIYKAKENLRAAAMLAIAADHLERVESRHRPALDTYARIAQWNEGVIQTVRGHRGIQESRISTLCWQFKAWLLYRMYNARKLSIDYKSIAASKRSFANFVQAFGTVPTTEADGDTSCPTKMLIDMKTELELCEQLYEAFDAWQVAETVLNSSGDTEFFSALESSLGYSLHLLSLPKFFIRYVKEFIARIEHFGSDI